MLESEPNDREFHDHATGAHGAGELSAGPPGVPAAVFQPPQVVFQPPTISWPEPSQPGAPPASASGTKTRIVDGPRSAQRWYGVKMSSRTASAPSCGDGLYGHAGSVSAGNWAM